ncbi:hypothetical protein NP493_2580g00001 [Ridgeia piscesae]|uniref:Btz domain-containing protein n=1 Tax=Ridgeia piscesae TaxID=27915 RepID=A0AAD9JF00_RIDPI|nr:hypothetical protein NP493_2580g00001 [Ridgeia piscesae]
MSIHSTFDPPEQITIGIERNIPGNEPAIMRSEFRPEDVMVIRRKDEGVCPFYERQEFQMRQEDEEYSERRVVKIVRPAEVQRGARGGGKFEQEYQMKNFEVQSGRYKMEADSCTSERVTLSDRWGMSKRDPEVLCSHAIENVIHHRHDLTDTERSSGEFGEWDRYQRDPHDLRHNLVVKRRTGVPDSVESRCTVRYRFGRGDDGEAHRPREGIQQGRRGSAIGVKPRLTSLVGHAEVGARSMDTRNVLPDFSKRENKYDYQAWEDHPEMIPRGSSYFEHDNRDDFNYRGRRGFGRGPFRGGGRGRGAGRRDFISSEPAWKHDKYEEIEDEDDNKPTSTT